MEISLCFCMFFKLEYITENTQKLILFSPFQYVVPFIFLYCISSSFIFFSLLFLFEFNRHARPHVVLG